MINNLFIEYVETARKRIYKYIKFIFKKDYDQDVAEIYVDNYINARYYNLSYKETNRIFYLRIKEVLLKVMQDLLVKNEKEKERTKDYVNYRRKEKIITNMFTVFDYIFFFDKVREIENMKKIKTIDEVIDKLYQKRENEYLINERVSTKQEFTELIKSDMESSEEYLNKYFADRTFELAIKKFPNQNTIYDIELISNVTIPMIYSQAAIDMAFNSELISEDRLLPEYALLSLFITRDIVESNFKDQYIVEFTLSLLKKKQKLKNVLELINDPALQDKINLKVPYEDLEKNKKAIFELMKEGYKFAVELDNSLKDASEIEKLTMFSYIVVPKKVRLYKEIMRRNKKSKQIIFE
ncbi:MAG: hypothetical protein IJ272_03005 [Clostridia bacterium]|nr:hypothetical protein [Clostridia bacterium]